MIFDNVKSIVIPEGSVKEITCNNVTLWQKIRTIIETVSGVGTIVLQNVVRLVGITQYGKCEQASTPTPSAPVDIKCNNGTFDVSRNLFRTTGSKSTSNGVTFEPQADGSVKCYGTATGYANWTMGVATVNASMGTVCLAIDGTFNASGNIVPNTTVLQNSSGTTLYTIPWTNWTQSANIDLSEYPTCAKISVGLKRNNNSTVNATVKVSVTVGSSVVAWRPYRDIKITGTPEVLSITAEDEYEDDIVTFDASSSWNISKLSVNIEPVQAGSGDPSPDNVRPISGHTSVNVIVSPTLNPLDGTTYPITLGQTVYSGTLDVTTGVLTSNYGIVDMGSLDWTKVTDLGKDRFYATVPDMVSGTVRTLNVLSSCYKTNIGGAWDDDKTIYNGGGSNRVYVHDINYTEVSVFKTAVTGQTIAYPLAEPLTYQIDPTTINLLLGENNIWSDVGAIYIVVERVAKQTASVANLFAINDDKDEQDIVSGEVTRKVGVRVLDGREEWTTDTYGGSRRFVTRNFAKEQLNTVMCTHYSSTIEDGARTSPNNAYVAATGALAIYIASTQSIDTVEDWTAYLAAQYANGTPVVVVYLLAESTEESVTPQSFTVSKTATISAESDYVDDIALSGTYETPEA